MPRLLAPVALHPAGRERGLDVVDHRRVAAQHRVGVVRIQWNARARLEATVVVGSEKRVLKKQESAKGSSYSDGTLGLKMRDPDPARNAALVDEYGQVTTLMRCIPAAS